VLVARLGGLLLLLGVRLVLGWSVVGDIHAAVPVFVALEATT
jgi:hypothetical protein